LWDQDGGDAQHKASPLRIHTAPAPTDTPSLLRKKPTPVNPLHATADPIGRCYRSSFI